MTVLAQGEQGRGADNRGQRPLLRGWLHAGAFFAWLIGGPFLIAAGPDAAATAELAVYVAGMLAMFGTSAAFHRLRWSAPAWRRMRRADHSAIFVGIAGTCTAVVGLSLRGWSEILLLDPGLDGGHCGHCLAPALPRCTAVGGRHPLRGGGLVSHHCGAAARSQSGLGRVHPDARGRLVLHGRSCRLRPQKTGPMAAVFGFHEVFHACTLVGAGLFAYLVVFIALPRY